MHKLLKMNKSMGADGRPDIAATTCGLARRSLFGPGLGQGLTLLGGPTGQDLHYQLCSKSIQQPSSNDPKSRPGAMFQHGWLCLLLSWESWLVGRYNCIS